MSFGSNKSQFVKYFIGLEPCLGLLIREGCKKQKQKTNSTSVCTDLSGELQDHVTATEDTTPTPIKLGRCVKYH